MPVRCMPAIALGCFALAAMVSACAEPTRSRVLSFFFDGVPPAVERSDPAVSAGALESSSMDSADAIALARPKSKQLFPHDPYRLNRCGGCHDTLSGGLVREPRDGLCRICHSDIKEGLAYVHGPIAVDECLFCHHYHVSYHPHLLLDEPAVLCLRCHDSADLTTGEHHQDLDRPCDSCHDPHGGENRYFLGRGER